MKNPDTAILVTGRSPRLLDKANELLPLLGRPLLQRAIEALAGADIRNLHVMLGEDPRPTRRFLDDGSRWGCRITYHHSRDGESLGSLARRLGLEAGQHYVLADAARMPAWTPHGLDALRQPDAPAQIWISRQAGRPRWSGWGSFAGEWLRASGAAFDGSALEASPADGGAPVMTEVATVLSVMTPEAILASARHLLIAGKHQVTLGRGCRIHPTAKLLPPVWLGEKVHVGPGCTVGPEAVIEDGTMLERDGAATQALVLPRTFVGSGLGLDQAIAAGRRLVNVRLDTMVEIADAELLSSLPAGRAVAVPALRERAAALSLRLCLLPLRIACGLNRDLCGFAASQPSQREAATADIRLAMGDPSSVRRADGGHDLVRHFRHCFYPGLKDVAAGRLRLLGPTPRPSSEVADLPEVWRLIYARNRSGLLNEGLLSHGEDESPELQLASDSVAAATQDDVATRRRVLRRYLKAVLSQLGNHWTRARPAQYAKKHSRAQRRTAWN